MKDLTFDDLRWLYLLWAVLAVAVVGGLGVWRRRRALQRFASIALLPRLTAGVPWGRNLLRVGLIVVALVLLVAALVGPRWGEVVQPALRRNIDVLVLLDVSRSMLARDIAPSRLERAKLAIRDDLLPALGGDRVGLIAFAGAPSVVCPLTTDYGFYRLALDDVGVHSAPRGGTAVGDAIRKAGELFAHEIDTHKVVILITDGEDHGSFPVEAAAGLWQDHQAAIVALALGDAVEGARIPVAGERGETYLRHGGEVVWSKADAQMLSKVVGVSERGLLVDVGTRNFDLGKLYEQVATATRYDEQTRQQRVHQPARYHPFAVGALLLVLLDSCLRDGPRRRATHAALGVRKERAA